MLGAYKPLGLTSIPSLTNQLGKALLASTGTYMET